MGWIVRRKMKRYTFLALSLILVLSMILTGCKAATKEPAAAEPIQAGAEELAFKTSGSVNYYIGIEPTTLLAWETRNPTNVTVLNITNEFLMKYDEKGIAQPYLLESIAPDKAALTFTLVFKEGHQIPRRQ
jgi:ABC-type oligopeptide transport system substrate-binding subunit